MKLKYYNLSPNTFGIKYVLGDNCNKISYVKLVFLGLFSRCQDVNFVFCLILILISVFKLLFTYYLTSVKLCCLIKRYNFINKRSFNGKINANYCGLHWCLHTQTYIYIYLINAYIYICILFIFTSYKLNK